MKKKKQANSKLLNVIRKFLVETKKKKKAFTTKYEYIDILNDSVFLIFYNRMEKLGKTNKI